MKVLKPAGRYLLEKSVFYGLLAVLCFVFAGGGLLLRLFSSFDFSLTYVVAGGIGFVFFFKQYIHYRKGYVGEQKVTKQLQQGLDDNYFLLNDVTLEDSYGNIDHIVLGPTGIFVIETKHFEGTIRCEGDDWYQSNARWRTEDEYAIASPSKQVKGNALSLKKLIVSKKVLPAAALFWIEAIVVFVNKDVELETALSTVPVVKLGGLCAYIKNKQPKHRFSREECNAIGNAILEEQIEAKQHAFL